MGVKDYAAVNTKIRVLKRDLLAEKDYKELVQKENVQEISQYLKNNTAYKNILENIDASQIHRAQLEILLKRNIISNIEKIIHYFNAEYRSFLLNILKIYEIEDIKLILRALSRNENMSNLKNFFIHSEKYTKINYDALLRSNTIEEAIQSLRGSSYYLVLSTLSNDDFHKREFHMEMQLEKLIYKNIIKSSSKLKKEDRSLVTELIGINIDLINIQWIYRAKRYYNLSPEEIFIYSIEDGRYYNYKKIKKLCYFKDYNEIISYVKETKYSFIFPNEEDIFIERRIKKHMYTSYLRYSKKENLNIIEVLSYIFLLEFEVKDIISIVETIRYSIPSKHCSRYIIKQNYLK